MARKRRVLATDGLDAVVQVYDTAAPDPAIAKQLPVDNLRVVEAFWARIAAEQPVSIAEANRDPLSLAAYAFTIARNMEILRAFQRAHPQHADLLDIALFTGYQMADARWRHNRGAQTLTGKKQRAAAPRSGQASGVARQQAAERRDEAIEEAARDIRKTHKYDRVRYSTHRLAITIAMQLRQRPEFVDLPASTVRSTLITLKIK